jgi:hypothetical protein
LLICDDARRLGGPRRREAAVEIKQIAKAIYNKRRKKSELKIRIKTHFFYFVFVLFLESKNGV